MNKITKLHISKDKNLEVTLLDGKTKEKTYEILVNRKNKPTPINIKNLSNSKDIKLYYSNGKEIKLPEKLMSNLSIYIKTQHDTNKIIGNNEHFDCTNFAHFINGVPYNNDSLNLNNWHLEKFISIEDLSIGDTILSGIKIYPNGNAEYNGHHYSIYLGNGLFMGKLGDSPQILIYNIDGLKIFYPFDKKEIFKLIKKED